MSSATVTASLSFLALCTLFAVDAAGQAESAEPTVEYLANEGVLLRAGDVSILIDALFGDGLSGYPVVARAARDALESGRGRFGEVDLLLVTHAHADHFDPAAVRRHLQANQEAVLVAPADAIDSLDTETGGLQARGDRLRRLTLAPGDTAEIEVAGGTVEALGLAHAGIGHVAYRVELAGMTVLHLGDAQPAAGDLAPLLTSGERPDVALVPFWVLTGENSASLIEAIDARCVVAMHLERESSGIVSRLAERVPSAVLLDELGERVSGDC